MQPTTHTIWTTVREGRWEESWGTCLLHLQSEPYEDYGARDHAWLEEADDGSYRITYGGVGSTGVLAVSRNADALRALLASDAAIETLFGTAAPDIPVFA